MPIVSSEILSDDPQVDNRRWVVEIHTDHTGKTHLHGPYMIAVGAEPDLAGHAAQIEQRLQEEEISNNSEEFIGADF